MVTETSLVKNFTCVPLQIGNTSALRVAGNQIYSSRAKHVVFMHFNNRDIIKGTSASIHDIPTK